jgi:Zn-dependent protease
VAVVAAALVIFLVRTHHLSRFTLIYFCVLIPSIILHEISHGFVANVLGDDTAKRAGRLTLNPVPHIDPMGSVVVPGLLLLSGAGVAFGWAKPVPVNVGRLRRPRNGSVWVSLAGPATNAVLFVAAALAFRYLLAHQLFLSPTATELPVGYEFLLTAGLANITIGVFNLIPIPPLDGSAVIERLVPTRHLQRYYQLRPYGMLIVFAVAIFVLPSSAVGNHLFGAELHLWNAVSGTNL